MNQILTNASLKVMIAIPMQLVETIMAAISVHVMKVSLEMEHHAQVSEYSLQDILFMVIQKKVIFTN